MVFGALDRIAGGDTRFLDPQSVDPDYQGADAQMSGATSLLAEKGAATKQEQNPNPPIKSITTTFDASGNSRVKIDASKELADWVQQMAQTGVAANKASDALVARLRSKQEVLDRFPILAQLGRVASLGAASYQAPGSSRAPLVRAAGIYGGEYFKDTPEELQAQIAAVEQDKMRNLMPVYNAMAGVERSRLEEKRFAENRRIAEEQLNVSKGRLIREENRDLTQGHEILARTGQYADGNFTKEAQPLVDAGNMTPSQVAAIESSLQASNKAYYTRKEEDEARALAARLFERSLTMGLAAQERAAARGDRLAEKAIGDVGKVDEKIVAAYSAEDEARNYFSTMAAQLGKPSPGNVKEAQAILVEYLKDPMRSQQAPEIVSKASKLIDNFDNSAVISQLKTERAAKARRLGKEDADLAANAPKSRLELEFFSDHGRDPNAKELDALRRGRVEQLLGEPAPPPEQGGIIAKAKKILDSYELTPKARKILQYMPPIYAARELTKGAQAVGQSGAARALMTAAGRLSKPYKGEKLVISGKTLHQDVQGFLELLQQDLAPDAMAKKVDAYLKGD